VDFIRKQWSKLGKEDAALRAAEQKFGLGKSRTHAIWAAHKKLVGGYSSKKEQKQAYAKRVWILMRVPHRKSLSMRVHTKTGRSHMGASTIEQFCNRHQISVAFFYELLQAGKGPRVRAVGKQKRIITDEDAAEWRRTLPLVESQQTAA
jgi:hypothetical protein